MALWHWLVGGAVAYHFFKDEVTSAVCPGQPVPSSPEVSSILNHMTAAGFTGCIVMLDASKGGYYLKHADGTASQGFNTLAELLMFVQSTYPAAGIPAEVSAPPSPIESGETVPLVSVHPAANVSGFGYDIGPNGLVAARFAPSFYRRW